MEDLPISASNVTTLSRVCERCRLRDLCFPVTISEEDVLSVRRSVVRIGPLTTGEHLFHAGDRFRAIYAVRSGCIETCRNTRSGRKEVLRFHFAGEVLGLDAIHTQSHPCDAIALEESTVCALPYRILTGLAWDLPALHEELIRLMSKQIADEVSLSTGRDARERIAGFLVDVMQRREEHGDRFEQLVLPMSREDIASRLHLATETVSRAITRLQSEGVIEARRKSIRLLDTERLTEIADG
jgi:CRP/FNR family transcriptional regulator